MRHSSPSTPRRSDDRALVRRMGAGDESAFAEFFEAHFQGLYRFVLVRVDHDRELAKELTQTAICKGIEHLDTFRGEASLFTWLCSICRFEISGHFRKLRRRPPEVELPEDGTAALGALESLQTEAPDPEAQALRGEVARLVHVAADHLPPHYREALAWKYLDGLSVREIAARLELTPKAAESVLSRARRAFRDTYTSLLGPAHREPRSETTP